PMRTSRRLSGRRAPALFALRSRGGNIVPVPGAPSRSSAASDIKVSSFWSNSIRSIVRLACGKWRGNDTEQKPNCKSDGGRNLWVNGYAYSGVLQDVNNAKHQGQEPHLRFVRRARL